MGSYDRHGRQAATPRLLDLMSASAFKADVVQTDLECPRWVESGLKLSPWRMSAPGER